jgi:hypothetical protein
MAKKRDYKAEYRRRIANAEKRGLTRSQARGHPRPGEKGLKPSPRQDTEQPLEAAFKMLREVGSQKKAAKAHRISVDRLRRYVRQNALAEWTGRHWHFTDTRPRQMQVISGGEISVLTLKGFEEASLNGRHLAAVKSFLSSNDIELLKPFVGQSVTGAKGKRYPLETNPNTLHRLAAAGTEVFHEVYRLVF